MKNQFLRRFVAILMLNLLTFQQVVEAATITLATSPLANSTTDVVRPNLMYVLDDSGSMDQDYTPDYIDDTGNNAMCWKDNTGSAPYLKDTALSDLSKGCSVSGFVMLNQSNDIPFVTSSVNYQYYNPSVRYTPPVKADGTSYPDASTTSPKSDGFLSATGTNNLFTTGWKHPVWCNSSGASPTATLFVKGTGTPAVAGDTANWTCKENANTTGNVLYPDNTYIYAKSYNSNAFYYSLLPWEHCTDSTLTSCIASTTPSGAYTEPSTMRWCASFNGNTKFTGCQGRWDATHKIPKYLGYVTSNSYGSITVTDATAGRTITQIQINSNNLLSSTVTATGTINTTAQAICNAIKIGPSASIYDVRSGSTTWGTCSSVASGLVEVRRKTADAIDNGQAITVSGPSFNAGSQASGTITITPAADPLTGAVQVTGITAGATAILTAPQSFPAGTSAAAIASTLAGAIGNGYTATASGATITITRSTVGVNTSALALTAPGTKAAATLTVGSTGHTYGADLGGIEVSSVPIVGHLTSSDITNGTSTNTNATTIKNRINSSGTGYTATCAGGASCTSNVLTVTAPTAAASYNGSGFTFVNGTASVASGTPAVGKIVVTAQPAGQNSRITNVTFNSTDIMASASVNFASGSSISSIASSLSAALSTPAGYTKTISTTNVANDTVLFTATSNGGTAPSIVVSNTSTTGTAATATITVGTSGQSAGVPANLGGLRVTDTNAVTYTILGSTDFTNGTSSTTNAGTIRGGMISGFTGSGTGTSVTVTSPLPGDVFNGRSLVAVAGTTSSAVFPTGLIIFGGTTTSATSTARINRDLSGSKTITVGSVTASTANPLTITGGNSRTPAQVASVVAASIGTGGTIKAYVGGNTITPTCAAQTANVVCLVDNSATVTNGKTVSVGSRSNFGGVTVATSPTANGNAGVTNFVPALTLGSFSGGTPAYASQPATASGSAGTSVPAVDNFAPFLSGTTFSGGVDALASTGSNLSGGTDFAGTIVTTTTPMTNGSATPARSDVGLFKRTDIVATAANGNTYKDGTLIADGTTMSYSKTAGRVDCITTAGICTATEELQNFANWYSYYRIRDLMMKSTSTLAFSGLNGGEYNVGYDNISNCDNASCATSVVQGVGQFIDSCTGTCTCSSSSPYACTCGGGTGSCQRSTWWSQMTHSNPSSTTPLRASTAKIGLYYAAKLGAQTGSTPTQNDPMAYSCQQNYMLLVTDGYWNEPERSSIQRLDGTDIANVDNIASGTGKVDRPHFDGQVASTTCPAVSSTTKRSSASSCRTLSDITYYYYNTDLRDSSHGNSNNKQISTRDVAENNVFITTSDPNKNQHMTFFGLGLGVDGSLQYRADYNEASSGDYADIVAGTRNWPAVMNLDPTAVDDLWHAAVNGHGKYFSARDPDSVRTGLTEALNSIQLRVGAAAAAATSNLMPTKTDNGAYVASYGTVEWWGDLQARNIDVDNGGAVSESAKKGTPDECVNDGTHTDTGCLWSAQKKLDALDWSSQRKAYIAPTSGTSGASLRSLTYGGLSAAEKAYFNPTTGISQYSAIHTAYPGYTADVLASSLVDFLRGDPDSEQDGAGGDQLWRNRIHVLGDIVNTQPVYVRGAAFTYDDTTNPGYDAYILANVDRQSVVYVSANDGYLHAFAAQDSADGTITGGTELFAFMPSLIMPTIKELADVNYVHQYFVDGLITVGDVYFDSAWHTVLVGGLGGGGKSYYALDITNPLSPKYLWEISSATTGFENLGYTYGNASINKLPSGSWAVMFGSGYNNADGKGYLYAVNPKTGAMVSGFPLTTNSGTTASPSNLGKINAWVDNLQVDNTATDVYAGDLEGDLWRFNLITNTVSKLAHLDNADSPTPHAQPITTKPEMTEIDGTRVIFVGTGQYLAEDDKSNINVQSFYAIRDDAVPVGGWNPRNDTNAGGNPAFLGRKLIGTFSDGTGIKKFDANCNIQDARVVCSAESSPQVIARDDPHTCGSQTINKWPDRCSNGETATVMNWEDYAGWYVDFPDSGERMNVDMNLSLGTLTFGTNVPVSNACTTGGYGWLNYLDYNAGLNVPGTELFASEKIGNALIVGINVVKLPDGSLAAIVTTSDNKHTTVEPSFTPDAFSGKRSLWREFDPY